MKQNLVPVFVFGGFFGLFAILIVAALVTHKKRMAALESLAQRKGWQFAPGADRMPESLRRRMQLFSRGRRSSGKELLTSDEAGTKIEIFTFSYTSGSGKNKSTRRQTVIALMDPGLSIPEFSLSPENFLHKFVDALGFPDIDFSDRPEFSKAFRLTGENEALVREFFNPELTRELQQRGRICIEGSQDTLIFFQEGRVLPVEAIEGSVADCLQLKELLSRRE